MLVPVILCQIEFDFEGGQNSTSVVVYCGADSLTGTIVHERLMQSLVNKLAMMYGSLYNL